MPRGRIFGGFPSPLSWKQVTSFTGCNSAWTSKDWKPMPAIGAGVREIRVQAGGTYRVIYAAKYLISGLMQKGF